jgi:hypothetical protein
VYVFLHFLYTVTVLKLLRMFKFDVDFTLICLYDVCCQCNVGCRKQYVVVCLLQQLMSLRKEMASACAFSSMEISLLNISVRKMWTSVEFIVGFQHSLWKMRALECWNKCILKKGEYLKVTMYKFFFTVYRNRMFSVTVIQSGTV